MLLPGCLDSVAEVADADVTRLEWRDWNVGGSSWQDRIGLISGRLAKLSPASETAALPPLLQRLLMDSGRARPRCRRGAEFWSRAAARASLRPRGGGGPGERACLRPPAGRVSAGHGADWGIRVKDAGHWSRDHRSSVERGRGPGLWGRPPG